MADTLYELLHDCTVKLTLSNGECGTGFFVAPGRVLTCEHVVRRAGDAPIAMRWRQIHNFAEARVEQVWPEIDLALLTFEPPQGDLPCVYLDDEDVRVGDQLYLFGYPAREYENGRPITPECEGFTGDEPPFIMLEQGQVQPGMSGAALLNRRTGKVCGMAKFTRDEYSSLGGGGVKALVILQRLPVLAEWQQSFHQQNRQWQRFVDQLDQLLCRPFQAPLLSQYFVQRPEPMQAVKALLLPADRKPGTLVVSAIYGMGGIGKSVLAALVAHDPEVRGRFADGVLWAPLGQTPDLLALLSIWMQALGDYTFNPTTVDIATSHLRALLYNKRMLLVVDDVWNPDHAEPFLVGGEDCCVLVTTRRPDIAEEIGADLVQLKLMSLEQALKLLSNRLRRQLRPDEAAVAQRLTDAVGYLPIALEMVASRIARGVKWPDLCADLDQEVARLEALEAPRRRYKGETKLEACFNLSLNALKEESLELWESFVWLGVIPEDAIIAAPMATTLWNVEVAEASDRLEYLFDESLLLAGTPVIVKEQSWNGFRIHDLLRDVACRLLPQIQKRTDKSLKSAHSTFLEQYWKNTHNSWWHTLPEDGYIHAHLTWHMEQAGQPEAIHGLLQETRGDGRNGWYEACDAIGQPAQFVSDLGRAWRLAEELYAEQPTEAIVLQCRYALIQTTLNTLSINIPADLISEFLRVGFWSPNQVLSYARHTHEEKNKSEIIKTIVKHLPKAFCENALEITQNIENDYFRAYALSALAENLPGIYIDILDLISKIRPESSQASILLCIICQLPENLYSEVLNIIRKISTEHIRVKLMFALSKICPELYPEILSIFEGIESSQDFVNALADLPEGIPDYFYEKVLEITRKIKSEACRAKALCFLANKNPGHYLEALETIVQIQDESSRVATLRELANKMPSSLHAQMLEIVCCFQDEYDQKEFICLLAGSSSVTLSEEMLKMTEQFKADSYRVTALCALSLKMPELFDDALNIALRIENELEKSYTLREVVISCRKNTEDSLSIIENISLQEVREQALRALGKRLSKENPDEALSIARMIYHREDYVLEILNSMASNDMTTDLCLEILTLSRLIKDELSQAKALIGLSETDVRFYPEAIGRISKISDEYSRYNAILVSAKKLPRAFLPRAMQIAFKFKERHYIVEALRALFRRSSADLSFEVLRANLTQIVASSAISADFLEGNIDTASWQKTLRSLANNVRNDAPVHLGVSEIPFRASMSGFLTDIPKLSPAIVTLGGEEALHGVVQSMREICEWWP